MSSAARRAPRTDAPPDLRQPHVLREYALLADGHRGVLVGPRGDYAWMCFPRWDSEALFAALIGGRGTYAVTPASRCVWGGSYDVGLIWRSRWVCDDGIVECREALAVPSSPDRAVLLRRIVAHEGRLSVRVVLEPAAGFGRHGMSRPRRDDDGNWRARSGDVGLLLAGSEAAEPRGRLARDRALVATLELEAGEQHDLVLVCQRGEPDPPPQPDEAWHATEAYWRDAIPQLDVALGARDARHAVAVIHGLCTPGSGMVAAATMALPERAEGGRSYDYRYVWIRDQCYAGQALTRAGALALAADAVAFVRDRLLEDGPALMPAYTVAGERVPDETCLDLPGYPGGMAIAGNHANAQFQLDAFGEALLLFAAAARHELLDADGWRAAQAAADAIAARWCEPDAGVWETEPDEWTHSRLVCAAGLRAIAAQRPSAAAATEWPALADAIVAHAAHTALHPSGRWQRSPRDARPDAALLMAAVRGAVPPQDPRSSATLRAIARELTVDGYCYRYRPDARPLGEAEGAFLLCGFWLSLAFSQLGEMTHAVRWFERNRAATGPPGLLSEEFDVRQRQLRGNLPQAFVHALLLECAAALDPDAVSVTDGGA